MVPSELTTAWYAEMNKLLTKPSLGASRKRVKLNDTSEELNVKNEELRNYFNDKSCGFELPVQFNTTSDKHIEYLENVDNIGSLGCDNTKYPKYQNGKYCCLDSKSTVQEKLDYINMVLVGFFNITGQDVLRIITKIQYYIKTRKELIAELEKKRIVYDYDDLIKERLPDSYKSLDDWCNKLFTSALVEKLEGMNYTFESNIVKYNDETFYNKYAAIRTFIDNYKELLQLLNKTISEKVVYDDETVYIPITLPLGYTSLDEWYSIAFKKARLKHLNNAYFIEKYFNTTKYPYNKIKANIERIEKDIAERNKLIQDLTSLRIDYTDDIDKEKLQALLATIEKVKSTTKTTGGRKSKSKSKKRKTKSKKRSKSKRTIKHK